MPEVQGTSALVLGHGREGRSLLAFLARNYPQLRLGVADAKPVAAESVPTGVSIHSGPDYLAAVHEYDTVFRSPGIPPHALPTSSTAAITSLTNLFMEQAPGIVIAVSGTKGKSTTSSLIAQLLKTERPDVRLVGNIGYPALDQLEGATSETLFVLEVSSFQLADLRYAPHAAVLLNIVPEHLDYHGSFADYVAAKANITRLQHRECVLFCNPYHKSIEPIWQSSKAAVRFFQTQDHAEAQETLVKSTRNELLQRSLGQTAWESIATHDELPVRGPGNLENVAAAVAVATYFGISSEQIRRALLQFTPLPHRLEYIGTRREVAFYNDSLSTIPEATVNALTALGPAVQTLICGGHDRGLQYSVLAKTLVASKVKTLIAFPITGEKIIAACLAEDPHFLAERTVRHVETMEQAVLAAGELTPPNSICLLSPAASSLNLFRDYQDRGDQYRTYVNTLL